MAAWARPRSAVASRSRPGPPSSEQRPNSQEFSQLCVSRGDKHLRTVSLKPTPAARAALDAVAQAGPSPSIAQVVWALKGPASLSKTVSSPALSRCTSKGQGDGKQYKCFRSSSILSASPLGLKTDIEKRPASGHFSSERRCSSSKLAAEMHNVLADQLAVRKFEKLRDEICEGLRVLILGQKAPPIVMTARVQAQSASSPQHHKQPATPEQAIKIYNFFWTMLREITHLYELQTEVSHGETPQADACTSPPVGRSNSQSRFASGGDSILPRVSWSNLIAWVALEAQMSTDARHKSVSMAFFRALKSWKRDHVSPAQLSSGISLVTLLRWTWPHAKNVDIADTLSWICFHELEKISFPEPDVIKRSERRRLVDLFHSLDSSQSGFCSSEDIAGGERPDETKNIVDKATVEKVCGKKVDLDSFLEIMCQENFKGRAESMRVFLDDGRQLVRHSIKSIGFDGWVIADDDISGEDEATRKVVEALELEIITLRGS